MAIATQPIACGNASAQWMLYRRWSWTPPARRVLLVLLVLLAHCRSPQATPSVWALWSHLFELEMSVRVELIETSRRLRQAQRERFP